MNERNILWLNKIHSKIGYILAHLSSYSSLDLSKRIIEINEHIELINKTFKEQKNYIDVRNVIKLRDSGIDVSNLPVGAFIYSENAIKLRESGIDITSLPNGAFQYYENAIKLIEFKKLMQSSF